MDEHMLQAKNTQNTQVKYSSATTDKKTLGMWGDAKRNHNDLSHKVFQHDLTRKSSLVCW